VSGVQEGVERAIYIFINIDRNNGGTNSAVTMLCMLQMVFGFAGAKAGGVAGSGDA
jgi:hypothetical protein